MGILEIILCVIGVYNMILGFMMKTKNFRSAILFNIIPILSGIFVMGYALLMSGFIKIG